MEFQFNEGSVSKVISDRPPVIIGKIEKDVYRVIRNARDHLHRVHNAWGIEADLIDLLMDNGVFYMHLTDRFFTEEHYADLKSFKIFGIEDEDPEQGRMLYLPKEYWGIEEDYKCDSSGFVHLHVHSEFSALDGLGKIPELVSRAGRTKMKALALTDHGSISGIYKFKKACRKAGVKPLLGEEFYICDDVSVKTKDRCHIIIIAKNEEGYRNLLALSTRANLEGFYYRPRIDKKMLLEHKAGLILLSACFEGYPSSMILSGKTRQEVTDELRWWKENFGEDYYVEIMPDPMDQYVKVNPRLNMLAKELGIETVATCDVHYTFKQDRETHNALIGIQRKECKDQNPGFTSHTYWLQTADEVAENFRKYHPLISSEDYERMIANSVKIAEKVEDFEIKTVMKLPKVVGSPTIEVLAQEGFKDLKIPAENKPEYQERLKYELEVIRRLGFEDYFILIHDILRWAKNNGIEVGPGRGSVSGSLVAYLLKITGVDPIVHGLIFERFLNPGRKSMPDVDIDFDANRRDEVTAYINSKWKTAKISTYVGLQGKGAIKDCFRYFGISYGVAELVSKEYPLSQSVKHTIDTVIFEEPGFAEYYKKYPDVFKIARRIEGRLKTRGIHPAGVIISDTDIAEIVALRLSEGSEGDVVTQGDMEDIEALGLLKVDCLASKTQTTIAIAKKMAGGSDLGKVPLTDANVYDEFCNGNTWDIFQFQSKLGRDTVMKVKPKDFETLVAITALVRPGAIDFIQRFADDSHEVLMEDLKPILKDTRNIILYQEQSMRIAVEIAGFTLAQADELRKAIGKKLSGVMANLREAFVAGGVKKGHSEIQMRELFAIIEKSSNYSFNKSHAVAYTLCSYWSMWLKVYYPIEWTIAELTVQVDDDEKLKRYINDAIANGIEFLPPDINNSDWGFKKEGGKIRCGLGMVKKFSEKGYSEVYGKRPFKDFSDFFQRVSGVRCNKGAVQSLIKVGAFDSFGIPRKFINELVEAAKTRVAVLPPPDQKLEEWDEKKKAKYEKEALGFYLQGNPMLFYKDQLLALGINLKTGLGEGGVKGNKLCVAGLVENIKEHNSRNGEMAFLDLTGIREFSVMLWHQSWITYKGHFEVGDAIVLKARTIPKMGSEHERQIVLDTEKGDQLIVLK